MSTHDGIDDDIEVNTQFNISITALTALIRAQLLKDARTTGNLFGPTAAQKKTPIASTPQIPGTQRVF